MPRAWARDSSSERDREVSMRPGAMLLTRMRSQFVCKAFSQRCNPWAEDVRGGEVLDRLPHGGRGDEQDRGAVVHPRDEGAEQLHRPPYEDPEGVEPLVVA